MALVLQQQKTINELIAKVLERKRSDSDDNIKEMHHYCLFSVFGNPIQ
jgi:hypothetical protein